MSNSLTSYTYIENGKEASQKLDSTILRIRGPKFLAFCPAAVAQYADVLKLS